jgi:pimeloyl-ACP methyl ester carboxylesterase
MATFALVHGSWHGPWCWDLLVDELGKRGHQAVAPDLRSDDTALTWDTFAEAVTDALSGVDDPVLVGHSKGALTIPLVALRRPVKLLVYLCPAHPSRLLPDDPPLFHEGAFGHVMIDELGRDSWQPDDAIRYMYRHLDPELATWAAAQLRPDGDPGTYPVPARARLPTIYIYTTEDEFFTPEPRRWAARNLFALEPIEMDGGHFPMLERPSELADLLVASLESSRDGDIRQA